MLKDLFQYVVGLGAKELKDVNGQTFSTGALHLVEEANANTLKINTLSGIVDYVKSNFDQKEEYDTLLIQILSPTVVRLYSRLNSNKNRDLLVEANAIIPDFVFDRFYDTESFNIKMQSCFVDDEDKEIVLKVVGNIKNDEVKTYGDDGVSQTVTAKVGVANVENVVVPNPVTLRPYRTFQQVEQPASNFVFRMKSGPSAALFEADGGAWQNEAISTIQTYLSEMLKQEIVDKEIHIIA